MQSSMLETHTGRKVACELCGAPGEERQYIKLDDPELDLSDTFTRMFALAEHWMKRARAAEAIIGGRADMRNELPEPYYDLAASREREVQSSLDAERYRFLRNDDSWCDDGPVTWEVLGELSGTDFDKAVDDAIRALAQSNGEGNK